MEEITKPKQQNRICYVEPNDVFEYVDGQPITPPYEDFCISFDLIVKTFSRFKSSVTSGVSNGNGSTVYKINWTSKANDTTPSWVTFLNGSDVGSNTQSLSTNYTDISFNQYFKGEVVEGLGIEQIQVSFESWYCPTVVIKFVDVRGAAIFGREEAIHYDGKITADNVFGCFFTFPYPEFKLQIKGFVGQPVTFQLTCSQFKGELNSTNGNFEATATFIGYQYSLLTDIPLEYLIAAPNNPYYGISYWEKNKSKESWAMVGRDGKIAGEPVKLDYFFQCIDNAQKEYNEQCQTIDKSTNEELNTIQNQKTLLNNILDSFNNFYSALRRDLNDNIINTVDFTDGNPNRQILLFSKSKNIKLVESSKLYTNYLDAIKVYNDAYSYKSLTNCYFNEWNVDCPLDITDSIDFFDITVNADNSVYSSIKIKSLDGGKDKTIDNIKGIKLNRNYTLTQESASEIYKGTNQPFNSKFLQYIYVVNIGSFINDTSSKLEYLTINEKRLQKQLRQNVDDKITSILPVLPYIGNVFKLLFCHLETFCHIMYQAAKDIQGQTSTGQRNPSYLGISMDKTDISNSNVIGTVPPWPGVFNNGAVTEDGGDIDDSVDVFGWVGDFSHRFIEEEVVIGFSKGIQTIEDKKQVLNENENTIGEFPITTTDLNLSGSVFNNLKSCSLSELSGYLAIRAAQVFGIQDTKADIETASIVGKIDSLNYYKSVASASDIDGAIFRTTGSNNVVDVINGIVRCDTNYDNFGVSSNLSEKVRHKFETVGKVIDITDNRHPFYKENNWVHYYDNNNMSLIPSDFDDYTKYKNIFYYESNDGKPYFVPITNSSGNFIEYKNSLYLHDKITENGDKIYNKSLFNIYKDSSIIDSLMNQYNQLKDGNVKVLRYEFSDKNNLSKFIERYWKIGNDSYKDFFKNQRTLCPNIAKRNLDTNLLFNSNGQTFSDEIDNTLPDFDSWKEWEVISCQDDLTWKNDSIQCDISEMVIPTCQIYTDKITEDGSTSSCLFGHPFYYAQNKITDESIKNKVKALLYLHTLNYDYSKILNAFSLNKTNGCIESVPYGYLLLLGGLLWRKQLAEDPIIFDNLVYVTGNGVSYIKADKDSSLFRKENNRYNLIISSNNIGNSVPYNVPLSGLLGGNDSISWNIECQLIDLFENFCTFEFSIIKNGCEVDINYINTAEIKKSNSTDSNSIIEDSKGYYDVWHNKHFVTEDGTPWTNKNRLRWMRNKFVNLMQGTIMKYRMIAVVNKSGNYGMQMFLNEDNTTVQSKMKEIYTKKCVISDSNGLRLTNGYDKQKVVTVSENIFKAYVKGFTDSLSDIIKETDKITNNSDNDEADNRTIDRDLYIGIYYYLKNVWDKWLSDRSENTYDVAEFFNKNFIFIDSYYRNTYFRLPINCSYLVSEYTGMAKDKSLYSFIGDITKDHQCWFACVPDFIEFKGIDDKNNNMSADIETMKNVFRPLPYNSKPKVENSNKFVIVYTFKPSEVPSDVNYFKYDGFDVWSHTNQLEEAPRVFKSDKLYELNGDEITRMGYIVPSFGVSFARQNQHLFKNIRVSMNNPVETEHSLATKHNVISVGKSGERKVSFVGQDVFNIYSNYSYTCEVEMIGDAQISPLMYFQLLNVPMWKGTYMIYKVMHNMTAGNMTTTFTGIKMCKYPKPFGTSFFCRADDADTKENTSNSSAYSSSDNNYDGYISSDENYDGYISETIDTKKVDKTFDDDNDYYKDRKTGNCCGLTNEQIGVSTDENYKGVKINQELRTLFNCLYEEIANLPENKEKMKWNIALSSVIRPKETGKKSDHFDGNAIDIIPAIYDESGNAKPAERMSDKRYLMKVLNLIVAYHWNTIKQAILEYYESKQICEPNEVNKFNCLHIAITDNKKQEVFMTPNQNGSRETWNGAEWLRIENVDFKQIAKRAYFYDKEHFVNKFTNYVGCDNDTLNNHFELIRNK